MHRLLLLIVPFAVAAVSAQQLVPLDSAPDLANGAAYDQRRDRLVIFPNDGETWELDSGTLLHRATSSGTPAAPTPRLQPTMVFDAARGHVLLFGGTFKTSLADTWTYDGVQWTPRAGPGPQRRTAAGIAFDSSRNRVVMFGGQDHGTGVLSDTWEHDGTQWTPKPATVPQAINAPVMAFDSGRGVTVMVTSTGFFGAPMATWEWNGILWVQRAIGQPAPIGGNGSTMAFDPLRQRCVVLGGGSSTAGATTVSPGREIWEWDGTTWTLAATLPFTLRRFCTAWFDARRGRVLIAGGTESDGETVDLTTWSWDGVALTTLFRTDHPSRRYGHAWLSEIGGGNILFGGHSFGVRGDTWRWNGIDWTRLQPARSPAARMGAATALQLMTGRNMLFGGTGAGGASSPLGDFWSFDGTNWAALPGGPPGRSGAALAEHLFRNEIVLFGGASGPVFQAGSLRNDTWVWNGAWAQRSSSPSPPPRESPAMAFDLSRGAVVLFGGRTGATAQDQLDDSWQWDGAQWSPLLTPTTPPPLLQPSLVFDWGRARLLLTGTLIVNSNQDFEEHVWQLDPAGWQSRSVTTGTFASAGRVALDWNRGNLVIADGSGVRELATLTAEVTPYGTACGAPPPRLAMRARPRTGAPQSGLEVFAAPQQLCLFAVSGSIGNTPLGNGCTALIGGAADVTFAVADLQGMALLPWHVPASTSLRGVVAFAQAAALDPLQPGGFATSRALQVRVGD